MTIEEIFALLEKKFAGERKDGLRMLARTIAMTAADTEEETIKAKIEALTDTAVKDFIKEWRKEADAEITKSNQTAEENLRKKYDFVEKSKKEPEPPQPQSTEEMIKAAVAEALKPLNEKINAYETRDTTAARKGMLEAMLNEKKVSPSYKKMAMALFETKTFENDDAFNTYLEEAKTDADTNVQEFANVGLAGFATPASAGGNADQVSKAVEDYINDKAAEAKGESSLGGKKV